MDHHFETAVLGHLSCINERLCLLNERMTNLMATNAELVVKVDGLIATVTKIGTETATLKQMVADLQASAAGADPALVAKIDALAAKITEVDDMVPDQPPTP